MRNADIHWRKAVLNVLADWPLKKNDVHHAGNTAKYFKDLKGEPTTINPIHYAVLWRMEGISGIQKVHSDSGPDHYHAVVPFTSDYKIIVHPGTHLLHESYKDAKEDNIMSLLPLQYGLSYN